MAEDKIKKIILGEIPTETILQGNLYLFLPKNNRRIRIREVGQFLEKEILENYIAKGLNDFHFEPIEPQPLSNEIHTIVLTDNLISQAESNSPTATNAALNLSAVPSTPPVNVVTVEELVETTVVEEAKELEKNTILTAQAEEETSRTISGIEKADSASTKLNTTPAEEEVSQKIKGDGDEKIETSQNFSNEQEEKDKTKTIVKATKLAKQKSEIFTNEESDILQKSVIKAQRSANTLAARVLLGNNNKLSKEEIFTIIKSSGYQKEAKKIKLSQFLTSAIERASKIGSHEDLHKYKVDLLNTLESEEIPKEVLARYGEILEKTNIDIISALSSDDGGINVKAISKLLIKNSKEITKQLESNLNSIEKDSQEQIKSFSFSSIISKEDEESIFSTDTVDTLSELLFSAEKSGNKEDVKKIKASAIHEIKKLEAKKNISTDIKNTQEEIKKCLEETSDASSKNEKIIHLTNKLHLLEQDLVKISENVPLEQLNSWDTKLEKNIASKKIEMLQETGEIISFAKEAQASLANEVTVIKGLTEENKGKIKNLDIQGDITAELTSYIAILTLGLGYTNRSFITDLMTAGLLKQNIHFEQNDKTPAYINALLNYLKNESSAEHTSDVSIRDSKQILTLIDRYMKYPGYTSGRLKIDRDLFTDLCNSLVDSEDFDLEFLERVRQYVQRGITNDTILFCKEVAYDAKSSLRNILGKEN